MTEQTQKDSHDTGGGVQEQRIDPQIESPDASRAREAELQKTDEPEDEQ